MMKVKSETLKYLKFLFKSILNQFMQPIRQVSTGSGTITLPLLQRFQSDNGTEFLSKEFQSFFHE